MLPLPRRDGLIGYRAMLYRLYDQASVGCHQWASYLLCIPRFIVRACFAYQINRRFPTNAIHFPARRSSVIRKDPCSDKHTFPSVRRGIILFAVSLLALAVSACGSLKIALSSEVPQVDAAGNPLPVAVRLYQLSSKDRFQKADFLSLVKADEKTLGNDVLWRKETTLRPNTEMAIKEGRKKGAKYFAVMALFRDKDKGTVWRQVVDLDELWILSVNVKVQKRMVTAN